MRAPPPTARGTRPTCHRISMVATDSIGRLPGSVEPGEHRLLGRGTAWGTRRTAGRRWRRRRRRARSGRRRGRARRSPRGPTSPRASAANIAAPRRLACRGSATRSIVATHDVGVDLAPQVRGGAPADHAQRVEAALGEALDGVVEPSAVVGHTLEHGARTRWARVVASDRLWKPPRALRSSTGDRSPASHGVNTTSPLPAGTDAASVGQGVEAR